MDINLLTLDKIQKAFDKARDSATSPGFKLVLITSDYYEKALDFTRDHFITSEIIHKLSGVEWTDGVNSVTLQAFKHNLSLMFTDEKTGDAVAVIRTGFQSKKSYEDIDSIQTKGLKDVMYYCKTCDDQADFFGHYGTDNAFHIEALAVAENYRRKGLATNIFKATVSMICNLGCDPTFIKLEGSSRYSQKIFERAGFETLFEMKINSNIFPPLQFHNIKEEIIQKVYGLKYTTNI